jgi:hypothetical protein
MPGAAHGSSSSTRSGSNSERTYLRLPLGTDPLSQSNGRSSLRPADDKAGARTTGESCHAWPGWREVQLRRTEGSRPAVASGEGNGPPSRLRTR